MTESVLEETLGDNTVVFNTVQNAVQACMEMFGSRSHMIAVILPVTAPQEVLAGVIRGGAQPLLLDVTEDGTELSADDLKECLETLDAGAVVCLVRTNHEERFTSELMEFVEDYPTLVINGFAPFTPSSTPADGDFNLHYLDPWVGTGAVIQTRFTEQISDLKLIRSGTMGLGADLVPQLQIEARNNIRIVGAKPFELSGEPLHLVPEISQRWLESPSYPNAERLWRQKNGEEEVQEGS
jgi:hypothetical protein